MTHVGVLGGGQLGCMLATAVHDLGHHVAFYEPQAEAPAAQRFRDVTCASWSDVDAMARFLARCDVVTFETEHVPTTALAPGDGKLVPAAGVVEVAQDRVREKEFLRAHRLPHARTAVARGRDELMRHVAGFGLPCVVKTARGGYDGKGQWVVRTAEQLAQLAPVWQADLTYVLEELLDIELEASCIVARGHDGASVLFPIFENLHKDHILDLTLLPARVAEALATEMRRVAVEAAEALGIVGLLTTEFFVSGGRVLVNELAPRPHNSGHVTRAACSLSQFEALARILVGAPLITPAPRTPRAYCMANLLGDLWLARGAPPALETLADAPELVDLVLYGKQTPARRRKMGHLTVTADTPDEALAAARRVRDALGSGGAA